jgi:hypothetical protein
VRLAILGVNTWHATIRNEATVSGVTKKLETAHLPIFLSVRTYCTSVQGPAHGQGPSRRTRSDAAREASIEYVAVTPVGTREL